MKFFKSSDDDGRQSSVIEDLRRTVAASRMPPVVEKLAREEIEMLSRISPSSSEYTIGLSYIDYLAAMPWNKRTEDNLDMERAERVLNEEHYGLGRVKERILEHLAVKALVLNGKPRVLVADDEEITRKNLAHILSKEDYTVVCAADGRDALGKLETGEFDVVITDLKMPRVDGMEVLSKIRLLHPDAKVVIITGYATVPSAVEAIQKGAFHYIAKPFKLDEVRATVRQALEKKLRVRGTKGSVLCFAGPPGTGKTSMGMCIARALQRKFVRISLGGMRDEAEIRGHRRTYAGAKPGRIIEEIRRAESANPVMMLDELDKIGRDFKGDPASALLEVLDPEQNRDFTDHYLDVPFDLSDVLFILTANVVENIPAPLRDRMEVIDFPGYTQKEKEQIASRFLVPRQIREKGLQDHPPGFTQEALGKIIREYTREAGIRALDRELASICRKVASELVRGGGKGESTVLVTHDTVPKYLGKRKYRMEVAEEADRVGVTTGLVRTGIGGEIIFVEAVRMKGNKELILTGSLGDVMRESAQAALSYVRSSAGSFGIPEDFFEHHDIHIHVPSGAIQKDGPSAGLTIATALISLLTGRPAGRQVAAAGEITLTGRVLPIGGIREKILAAKRAGIRTVVLPLKNKADLDELGGEVGKDIAVHLVDTVDEAVDLVLAK
ncbi:MAG TPA: endopeptidase La [Dissulfurispiraceae bacterium]